MPICNHPNCNHLVATQGQCGQRRCPRNSMRAHPCRAAGELADTSAAQADPIAESFPQTLGGRVYDAADRIHEFGINVEVTDSGRSFEIRDSSDLIKGVAHEEGGWTVAHSRSGKHIQTRRLTSQDDEYVGIEVYDMWLGTKSPFEDTSEMNEWFESNRGQIRVRDDGRGSVTTYAHSDPAAIAQARRHVIKDGGGIVGEKSSGPIRAIRVRWRN